MTALNCRELQQRTKQFGNCGWRQLPSGLSRSLERRLDQ
jgi:hypothetical protein